MIGLASKIAVSGVLAAVVAGVSGGALAPPPDPPPPALAQQRPVLRARTDLVALSVTVTDRRGRIVTGLTREHFKVYEDDVEQTASFFLGETAPASWGIVVDRSGSMQHMMRDVYQAAVHTIDEGTRDDEMFIVTFDDQIELAHDFDSDQQRLHDALLGLRAGGGTALWDATGFAVEHARGGRHSKKVLMVITDGEDNASRIFFRELIERVEKRPVVIYTVGMVESVPRFLRWLGPNRSPVRDELTLLAERTGGWAHFPGDIEECRAAMKDIAREVSQQYSIGYYPTDTRRDGGWRSIRVVVGRRDGVRYVARTRAGYYAARSKGSGSAR